MRCFVINALNVLNARIDEFLNLILRVFCGLVLSDTLSPLLLLHDRVELLTDRQLVVNFTLIRVDFHVVRLCISLFLHLLQLFIIDRLDALRGIGEAQA